MAGTLFDFDEEPIKNDGPVTCLGITFENDDKRREYFREELRKKLPELRLIEGFPIGEDDDIITLSDPPYYTACPNPWVNNFIDAWEAEKAILQSKGKRMANFDIKEPYASDVKVGKSNPVYSAHTYHTKVPHPAIMRYLLHYTQPGDIVFDGFCGTGMTGVAAQACGSPTSEDRLSIEAEWKTLWNKKPQWGTRHAICGDLSPYASLVAYNYNTPMNPSLIKTEIQRIFKEVKEECSGLYRTCHQGKPIGLINYVVWSDIFVCNNCGKEFVYWNATLDKENKCLKDEFHCPYCHTKHTKNNANRAFETVYDDFLGKTVRINKSVPVYIAYTANGKRYEKDAEQYDIDLVNTINGLHCKYFAPTYELPDGYNTQQPKKAQNINYVHQFYTKRNLIALSTFFAKIQSSALPNKLKFIFTGMVNRSTKMNRIHVNNFFYGGGGWNAGHLKGTLYIPYLPMETSILEQIEDKLSSFLKAGPLLPNNYDNVIYVGSANKLTIADNSIDYVFTDPPFGANIMYSELNTLPEAWLKVLTNNQTEAIVNPGQAKDFLFYLRMMSESYAEYFRVLKPGKWMTVEFSNTNAGIWNSIQQAITRAGFVIANVSALNKGQGGMRAIVSPVAVKEDLAISCYKPSKKILSFNVTETDKGVWDFIEEHLEHLPVSVVKDGIIQRIVERDVRILYDRLISYYVQHGYQVPIDAVDFQKEMKKRYVERDGMFFSAEQALEYEDVRREHSTIATLAMFIGSEKDGIEWVRRKLEKGPKRYQDLSNDWILDLVKPQKGDTLPELMQILNENFIKDDSGYWHIPDINDQTQLDIIKQKRFLREFDDYLKLKTIKKARFEVLHVGIKECYKNKDFDTIVSVCEKMDEDMLANDEVLLRFYDIATSRI